MVLDWHLVHTRTGEGGGARLCGAENPQGVPFSPRVAKVSSPSMWLLGSKSKKRPAGGRQGVPSRKARPNTSTTTRDRKASTWITTTSIAIPDNAPWPRWCRTPCEANLANATTRCKSENSLISKPSMSSWTATRMISDTSAPWPKTLWKSTTSNKTSASPCLPTWTSSWPASPPVGRGSASARP